MWSTQIPGISTAHISIAGAIICLILLTLQRSLTVRWKGRERAPSVTHPPKEKEQKQPKPKPDLPYLLQFPPSRRHVLATLPGFEKVDIQPVAPETLKSQALPTVTTPDFDKYGFYTPTGFSTQDIKKLGRFPDYAALSGVRDPNPVPENWDIAKAKFRPYRPFRWGYHQHMALMKYDPDYWVELTSTYHTTMSQRRSLLAQHGSRIFFCNPCAVHACRELMEMVLSFLVKRYPSHFSLSPSADGLTPNALFHNRLLSTTTNLLTTDPLQVLFDNVPEDYALMLRNESDGLYYLRAAIVCSSVGWYVAQHRDSPLKAIHANVPDYESKMAFSMDRWFSRLPTDTPVSRCSWGLEDWEAFHTSPCPQTGEWTRSAFKGREGELDMKDIKLRCDAQTLRRLPVSAAVVFNFKAIFTGLEELREERYVPELLGKVLKEGKRELVEYKCEEHVRRKGVEALEGWAREQREKGWVEEGWEVGTLEESPFFPGWEGRWRGEQGF
ncbi:hypothetical protein B0T20DRAFT_505155 [Sordaria brevicollis]|uniref:Uncharacterized protein n=1 Tax=Sordaria brevicollis TaxID=83679 RepID=A0AAE0UEG3_SORBR|nr:hypothetical protein B0T20DRAFT_505155 [Sordaria brevicollis]